MADNATDIDALIEVVDAACRALGGTDAARALTDGNGYDPRPWKTLGDDIGIRAIGLPERFGGLGGIREMAAAAEVIGRYLTPVPFISHVLSTQVLSRCAESAAGVIEDALSGGLVVLHDQGEFSVSSGTLTGTTAATMAGADADWAVVNVDGALHRVDCAGPGVTISVPDALDATRRWALVTFQDTAGEFVCTLDTAALETGRNVAELILSAEGLGGAQACLDMTVAYVKERRQFGRPIGSFQAVKHTLADLLVSVEMARSAVDRAVQISPDRPEFGEAVSVARLWCSDIYRQVTAEAVQLHGGIGFTWDHDLHMYFRRARSDAATFGGSSRHRSRLKALLGLQHDTQFQHGGPL